MQEKCVQQTTTTKKLGLFYADEQLSEGELLAAIKHFSTNYKPSIKFSLLIILALVEMI